MIHNYLSIYVFMFCNSEFDTQTWRYDRQPTQKQLDYMRRSGIQGRPNFVTWFKEHALRAENVHPDLCQLSIGYIAVKSYGRYDINGFRFFSTIFEDARPLAATCNTWVVVRAVDDEGRETNYYGVIKDILEITFGGNKDLRVVFFNCDWFDPNRGTRENPYGMVEIKHEERVRGHDNFVLAFQCEQVYYMTYPCPSLSAWWVVYKVNPRERLHIPGDDSYTECHVQDEESYQIVQEDELPSSFNVQISETLDSLVGDCDDVTIVKKRKWEPIRKKKVKWRPWGTKRQLDPDFDDNWQVILSI